MNGPFTVGIDLGVYEDTFLVVWSGTRSEAHVCYWSRIHGDTMEEQLAMLVAECSRFPHSQVFADKNWKWDFIEQLLLPAGGRIRLTIVTRQLKEELAGFTYRAAQEPSIDIGDLPPEFQFARALGLRNLPPAIQPYIKRLSSKQPEEEGR